MCALSLQLFYDMCSNSVPESAAVKTNFIAEAKHKKMNIIGLEEHSLAPEWVPWGVQESEYEKLKAFLRALVAPTKQPH